MNQNPPQLVDRICRALNISMSDLARDLGVTRSAVSGWKRKNEIPLKHCKYLEIKLKGSISPFTCTDMRPVDWDKYWPEQEAERNASK